MKEHFSQYGEVEEIKILTRPDGKQTGVAFLQYNIVQSAAKAIHYANMQLLLNRPMIVDWAVPKTKFSQNSTDVKPEITTESIDEDEVHDISEIKASYNSKNDSDSNAESDGYVKIRIMLECKWILSNVYFLKSLFQFSL